MVEVQVGMEPMEVKLNGRLPSHIIFYMCDSWRSRAGVPHPPEELNSPNQAMVRSFMLWRKLQDDVQIALGQVIEIGPRSKERQRLNGLMHSRGQLKPS